ncbi:hypothetical protein MHF_1277 [Mycoplasma haemofelis Ohio2]|uniref:Uncharacterized protein n=1 Tax=Mycoplasma haemofelis (strain Ohio2) TaxID=859194 RepID=F6FFU5_MYCHI|nr:hypothetical protein MHF_1277 [Mycoplasma haemofelis Ohio2]
MATSLASKALAGLAGAGAVGGTAAAGYKIFNQESETPKAKKTISQLIKDSGTKTLLTASDSKEGTFWKAAWKAYRTANKSSKASEDPWAVSGFTGNYGSSISDEKAPDDFVNKCVSLSGKEVEGVMDGEYVQVSNWCTRDRKVAASSFLDSDSKVLLKESDGASGTDWKNAWEVYRKEHSASNTNPWNINEWAQKKDSEQQNAPTDFVSKCAAEATVLVEDKDSPIYQSLSKYCTKAKAKA